jgi:RNA polymerase sigma-70 factor (ECF subfamily)
MQDEQQFFLRLKDESTKRKAFTELVVSLQEKLYWHIRRFVSNHDDAHDIIQNVFVKVWQGIEGFRGESRLVTWIYTITTNECLTFIKKNSHKATISLEDEPANNFYTLQSEVYIDGCMIQRVLAEALTILPERQRQVFEMRYYEELSYEHIAQILGVSVGALKASYHHAVKKIEVKILTSLNPISYQ